MTIAPLDSPAVDFTRSDDGAGIAEQMRTNATTEAAF
jgi:hypothetical protein